MMGATNDNLEEVLKLIQKMLQELKYFFRFINRNMLVDNQATLLENIFNTPLLIKVHCEDEDNYKK
jgi:dihydroorotase-like cyclic amidohydrolase